MLKVDLLGAYGGGVGGTMGTLLHQDPILRYLIFNNTQKKHGTLENNQTKVQQ